MPRPYSLLEITSLLNTKKIPPGSAIVIQPPNNGADSDEDSGEDDGGTVYNLPGSLLAEPAYIIKYGSDGESDVDNFPYECKTESSDSDHQSVPTMPNRYESPFADRMWIKDDLTVKPATGKNENASLDSFDDPRPPIKFFELFLDDEIVDLVVRYTNLYAESKGFNLGFTGTELKCFLGIIFMSGYIAYPKKSMLWEHKRDTFNPLVCGSMRQHRFETILSCLHVGTNSNLDPDDKFAKLRPLINKINEKCMKYAPNETYYNFNRIVVPYYGRNRFKQFIGERHIRYGYKFWCGATRLGYVCWFQPDHCYRNEQFDVNNSPVVKFCEALTSQHPGKYHFVLNALTSIPLLDKLSSMGHHATGRMSNSQTEKAPLTSNAVFRSKEMGHYDYRTDCRGNILCRWKGNSVITVASSGAGIKPLCPTERYSDKLRKLTSIQEPDCIRVYNRFKVGVNKFDENMEKYRSSIRGKKWYSSPLLFCFELMLQNSWQLQTRYGRRRTDLLDFRRSVANHYLEYYAKSSRRALYSIPIFA